MSISRSVTILFFLLMSACGPAPIDKMPIISPKTSPRGAITEFKLISYDGRIMKARVLLGATIDLLVIDGRLIEEVSVELKDLKPCAQKNPLSYYIFDTFPPPARPDQIVTIQPGYWYGTDVNFLLFGKDLKQPSPDCFEGNLIVWSLDRRIIAKHPIRVTRTDKPPAPPASMNPAPNPTTPTEIAVPKQP